MKKYPRIYGLSTLGIVHHQGFDYDFHPFRTDFVGEGGSGKSMISDLLQLIFVGSSNFRSPTKSTGPRKPNTMVLRTTGSGTDMGYAFLNIEVGHRQFIAIGIYLESSGSSEMFIIQDGENFETNTTLIPFPRPLSIADFQKKNTILPIDELKEHIHDTLGLTCQSWERIQNYHKILYKNEILPLDVSQNNKTLETYAKIIQAFSREMLDISKSESLQSFLFGDDIEKEIKTKFFRTVDELKDDLRQFEINLQEINLLTNKQTELNELLEIKHRKDESQKKILISQYNNYLLQLDNTKNSIFSLAEEYYTSIKTLPILKNIAENKLESLCVDLDRLNKEYETAFKSKENWSDKFHKKQTFNRWMRELNCSISEIKKKHEKYNNLKIQIDKFKILQDKLQAKNVLSFFVSLELSNNKIITQLEQKLAKTQKEIDLKERLINLLNPHDKNSLIHWVLKSKKILNPQEEAIVRKYQNENILVLEPTDSRKRYIPQPEELLKNITPYKIENNGFWINLNGILDFIPTNFESVFNSKKADEIEAYFMQESENINNTILQLMHEKYQTETLLSIFQDFENPDHFLSAWNSKKNFENELDSHEFYSISIYDLEEYCNLFCSDNLEACYHNSKHELNQIDANKAAILALKNNISHEIESFPDPIINEKIKEILLYIGFTAETTESFDFSLICNDSLDYFKCFKDLLIIHKTSYSQSENIISLNEKLNFLNLEIKKIKKQYTDFCLEEIDNTDIFCNDIVEYEKEHQENTNSYAIKYNTIVRHFLDKTAGRFEETYDFRELCEAILPSEIVNNTDILEKELINKIEKHLFDINIKNKKLNNRKLQKLARIIEEVSAEVSEQKNQVRMIQLFLAEKDKIITGGHIVSLDLYDQPLYPFGWMTEFSSAINMDLELGFESSLFETNKHISRDLEVYPSLTEKLLEAFYRSGGQRGFKPRIEDLLNPKSYYGIKFSIKNSQGRRNDGSSSQTYSAIALLCIGKLALIDRQSKGRRRKAIRFMAIDESEGLGNNFDMLHKIASLNDYQILSLSINPNKIDLENQHIYLLQNSLEDENVNYEPVPIWGFSSSES